MIDTHLGCTHFELPDNFDWLKPEDKQADQIYQGRRTNQQLSFRWLDPRHCRHLRRHHYSKYQSGRITGEKLKKH